MNEHETIADVIASMRDEAARADMEQDYSINDAAEMMREFAWRIEAAHKRERGDCAKLREALMSIWKEVYFYAIEEDKQDFAHLHEAMLEDPPEYKDLRNSFFAIAHLVDAALSAPPRNCDRFASAEEAWDAYDEWVESYRAEGETEPLNEFGWLFAPATEKEGGAK